MLMNSDKNSMALYVRVVEAGSFSKAASREGMPVSSVSRKIADVEKTLGVRLLERSTRQLRTTEIGQGYFAEHVRSCDRPSCTCLPGTLSQGDRALPGHRAIRRLHRRRHRSRLHASDSRDRDR